MLSTVSTNPIMPAGPQHLPPLINPMGSHLQCSALPLDVFSKTTVNASGVKVLQEAGKVSAPTQNTLQTLRKHRPAEALLLSQMKQDQEPKPVIVSPSGSEIFSPPLISIGPFLDAVLNRLKMEDQTLLRLHLLLGTVRSSRWENILASQEWGLHPAQASAPATALLKDVQKSWPIITRVCDMSSTSFIIQDLSVVNAQRSALGMHSSGKGPRSHKCQVSKFHNDTHYPLLTATDSHFR